MAIRFFCKRCHQLLGIASRKAGTEIQCPKCGFSQTVPSEEEASAAAAMSRFAQDREVFEEVSNLVVYDDEPAVIESAKRRRASRAETPEKSPSAQPDDERLLQPGRPVPPGTILYERRTIYIQGVLFLVLAGIAFGAGYFIGRGDASFKMQADYEQANKERVLIEGRLVYNPGTAKLVGDENAVIIALPERKVPEKQFSIQGIRPQDPPPRESQKTVRQITELGGAYARADASGAFSMVVPEQGKYHLLLISSHVARPKGFAIDEVDLAGMERYFRLADHLINRYKYRWTQEEYNVPTEIEHNFGRDGQ